MKQIRRSVFETNSSSTHSICIVTDRNEELHYPTFLHFRCQDFGWEFALLSDCEEKAAYLYASIISVYQRDDVERTKGRIMDMLAEEGIGCEFDTVDYRNYGDGFWGVNASVDHGGELLSFVKKTVGNKGRLLRYLFSPKSFVLTGNDNDDTYDETKINVDYKHEEYYKGN